VVSWDYEDTEHKTDYDQMLLMHAYLKKTFPLVHEHLELTVINQYSLLYCWKGEQHETQKAYLLTGTYLTLLIRVEPTYACLNDFAFVDE
jgi:hypothetical protein